MKIIILQFLNFFLANLQDDSTFYDWRLRGRSSRRQPRKEQRRVDRSTLV